MTEKKIVAVIWDVENDHYVSFTKLTRCFDWMNLEIECAEEDPQIIYSVTFEFVGRDEDGIARFNMYRN